MRLSIQTAPFDFGAESNAFAAAVPGAGAVVTFTGLVRDNSGTLQAMEIEQRLGDIPSMAQTLLEAGQALERAGQLKAAAEAYRDGAGAAREAGYTYLSATLWLTAGRAFAAAADTTAAVAAFQQVVRDFGETSAASEAQLRMAELGRYE